jgi:hypothetical protein
MNCDCCKKDFDGRIRQDIIMTEKELESYGKRLWALQEKGFTIKVIE